MTRLTDWMNIASRQPANEAVLLRCRALTDPGEATEDYYLAALRLHASSGRASTGQEQNSCMASGCAAPDAAARRVACCTAPWNGSGESARHCGRAAPRPNCVRQAGRRPLPGASGAVSQLTSQELQVVRLAAAGETNRDIAARLFLSPRTISHHLYRAFPPNLA